ncbi:hypothetical protein BGZ47_007972 [Haplosporangium gracile]|nr:hypothetical protein BGZ47_007972 [Haplosporangium gracile]
MTDAEMNKAAIEAAARECFVGTNSVSVAIFTMALQKRNVTTRKKLGKIVQATNYLALMNDSNTVHLTRAFAASVVHQASPAHSTTAVAPLDTTATPSLHALTVPRVAGTTKVVSPVSIGCDTDAIADLLGAIVNTHVDLEDPGLTDIFIDSGSNLSAKINGRCVQYDKTINHSDISTTLQRLPGGAPTAKQSNRLIFGQTLHRLATVTYDGNITGVTVRIGRSISGLLPLFEGLVENRNVLMCGAPNVGKTTTLREICKYLSVGNCLCLIDTSGEVCGDAEKKGNIVGSSRVFRSVDPNKQYVTLLDCVRNHSPDVIVIDELNTKEEVAVCQTIALRSIRMVASVHGNIQDLIFNPMLNKTLGGSVEALVSDQNAVDGRKVVIQRTTRPIFDVVINIRRTSVGLEYLFIEDVANNVSRIMQGKPIQARTRRLVGEELTEVIEQVLYPLE